MTHPPYAGPARRQAVTAAANHRRIAFLVGSIVLLVTVMLAVIGWLVGLGPVGFLLGPLLAAAAVAVACRGAEPWVLAVTAAGPVDVRRRSHARLVNLVEGLCLAAGLPQPALRVIDDAGRNAYTVGLSPRSTTLVVTSGLLEAASRIELEGVVARQLGAIRAGDTAAATVGVALVGRLGSALARLGSSAWRAAAGILRRMVGPSRDIRIDLAGVALTRYPPGLAAALEKVAARPLVKSAPPASTVLWLADPGTGVLPSGTPAVHLPIEQRIQALKEL